MYSKFIENNSEMPILKGTTLIGIKCKDGIVLAADMQVSSQYYRVETQNVKKIFDLRKNIYLGFAGWIASGQALVDALRAELALRETELKKEITVKSAASLVAGYLFRGIRSFPFFIESLVAGYDKSGLYLYSFDMSGSLIEEDAFVAAGDGAQLAYGALEALFDKNITSKKGREIAINALTAAHNRNAFTGNKIQVVVISRDSQNEEIIDVSENSVK